MIESTAHITADNMRADFLNASDNWQRWKILNRALGWAVTASENADAARKAVQEMERDRGEVRLQVHSDEDWATIKRIAADVQARGVMPLSDGPAIP